MSTREPSGVGGTHPQCWQCREPRFDGQEARSFRGSVLRAQRLLQYVEAHADVLAEGTYRSTPQSRDMPQAAQRTAKIAGEIQGQTIELASEGVQKITLCLSSEMLDLGQPVVVTWNGKKVHDGVVERDFVRCAQIAVEKVDWLGTFEAAIALSAGAR